MLERSREMEKGGARVWYFPDGFLPEKIEASNLEPHEVLMILNTNDKSANVKLDIYFEDREPVKDIPMQAAMVEARVDIIIVYADDHAVTETGAEPLDDFPAGVLTL
jgi:hypothetical protein